MASLPCECGDVALGGRDLQSDRNTRGRRMAFHPRACDSVRENGRGYRLRWTHTVHSAEHSSGGQGSSQRLSRLHCLNFDSHLTAPPVGIFHFQSNVAHRPSTTSIIIVSLLPGNKVMAGQRVTRVTVYTWRPCQATHRIHYLLHKVDLSQKFILYQDFFSWGLWIDKCLSQCLSTLILIQLIRKS